MPVVYRVNLEFFPMKAAAETSRKNQGLKADAVEKVSINSREELADLLNSVAEQASAMRAAAAPHAGAQDLEQVPDDASEFEDIPADRDFIEERDVPLFLRREHAARNGLPEPQPWKGPLPAEPKNPNPAPADDFDDLL